MPQKLLSKEEIKNLIGTIKEVFDYLKDLKLKNSSASYIKNPQIPSILTESIALHLIKEGTLLPNLNGFNFEFGEPSSDIIARNSEKNLKIEVKSTGKQAFQYLSNKDINSDYLIWMHFGDFFHSSEHNQCNIFILKDSKNYFDKPTKINLSEFKRKSNAGIEEFTFDLNKL